MVSALLEDAITLEDYPYEHLFDTMRYFSYLDSGDVGKVEKSTGEDQVLSPLEKDLAHYSSRQKLEQLMFYKSVAKDKVFCLAQTQENIEHQLQNTTDNYSVTLLDRQVVTGLYWGIFTELWMRIKSDPQLQDAYHKWAQNAISRNLFGGESQNDGLTRKIDFLNQDIFRNKVLPFPP